MDTVTLAHAREHLEELIERASKGEDVRIGDAQGRTVRLVPADGAVAKPAGRVVFGQWKHLSEIGRDRLLEPLSEEERSWLSGERSL